MIRICIRDNISALRQGLDLLGGLDPSDYRRRITVCFDSTPGSQWRHIIEHYESFLLGRSSGTIDYEARPRELALEMDPAFAAGRMRAIVERLEELGAEDVDYALQVRAETVTDASMVPWAVSSALRELEFLLSHTVHHFALIAVMVRLLGGVPPSDFGVAPSTLRHRQKALPVCAH